MPLPRLPLTALFAMIGELKWQCMPYSEFPTVVLFVIVGEL